MRILDVTTPEPARIVADPEHDALRLRGEFFFDNTAAAFWAEMRTYVEALERGQTLNFEMSGVARVDGSVMAMLAHLRAELQQRGVKSEFFGAAPEIQEIIHLYRGDVKVGRPRRRRARGTLDQIGEATMETVGELKQVLAFCGQLALTVVSVVWHPRTANFRDVIPLIERAGANALPIVALINFLVGLVMALQSAGQLIRFGANIFIADLIGVSMVRELGPLMTAIVVCGRSGAAFAAQLGTMKVNEEIDALRTMGFGPLRFLVLPRVVALMVVMPLLVLIADIVGVVGGMLVASASLDITPSLYFLQMQRAVTLWDLSSGLLKSVLFGMAIGLISCQQGLATSGGAEGVGRRTTSAVVITLFVLILIDAAYVVFFRALGL
jgi:phospholipid/cholesterol/gamma-HCH transport system permease protein